MANTHADCARVRHAYLTCLPVLCIFVLAICTPHRITLYFAPFSAPSLVTQLLFSIVDFYLEHK